MSELTETREKPGTLPRLVLIIPQLCSIPYWKSWNVCKKRVYTRNWHNIHKVINSFSLPSTFLTRIYSISIRRFIQRTNFIFIRTIDKISVRIIFNSIQIVTSSIKKKKKKKILCPKTKSSFYVSREVFLLLFTYPPITFNSTLKRH